MAGGGIGLTEGSALDFFHFFPESFDMVPVSKEKLILVFLHIFFYSAINDINIVMQLLFSFFNNVDWLFGEEEILLPFAWRLSW